VTLIRCGGLLGVSLVSHYLNDIPCKNYNYVFVFVKVMHYTIGSFFSRTRCRENFPVRANAVKLLTQAPGFY